MKNVFLSCWLMLLRKIFFVKCLYPCLINYLLAFIFSMIHFVSFEFIFLGSCFVHIRFRVSNSKRTVLLMWSNVFLPVVMEEISSPCSCYIRVFVYTLTVIVFYGWEVEWSGDRRFLAYMIIIFFVKCSR